MAEEKGKNWINFQELKASITFEQVLERLELLPDLERAGDELRGPCPICKRGDEKSKRFSVNVNKQVFQCFACKRRGSVLDFTAAVRGQDVHHAAVWLRDEFLVNTGVLESVQAEASRNGAGARDAAAESGDATPQERPDAAPEDPASIQALTEREQWLSRVIARGVARYLVETFRR
jgi:DNA primase